MKKIILFLSGSFIFSLMLHAQIDSTIPVRISSFNATSGDNISKLLWKTACSLDYARFEIQRSYNGNNYITINSFKADRFRCQQPFYFSDSSAEQLSGRVFYRLKVGDLDGKVYNSKTVSVVTRGEGIEINSLTPTMVAATATLSISTSKNDEAVIRIINIQGNFMNSQKIRLVKGVNNIQLNTTSLQPGKYWLQLANGKGEIKTVQFLKN